MINKQNKQSQFSILELGTVHCVSSEDAWLLITVTYFNGNHHQNWEELLKKVKKSTAEYNRPHKYWGIKAVFHTVYFVHGDFSASFKTRAISCDNIPTTFQKTFRSKCNINFFEIAHLPHSCLLLLGNFSLIIEGCSWLSFVVMLMMIFIICIVIFQ